MKSTYFSHKPGLCLLSYVLEKKRKLKANFILEIFLFFSFYPCRQSYKGYPRNEFWSLITDRLLCFFANFMDLS